MRGGKNLHSLLCSNLPETGGRLLKVAESFLAEAETKYKTEAKA